MGHAVRPDEALASGGIARDPAADELLVAIVGCPQGNHDLVENHCIQTHY
jgi:hypothetical protein